MEVQKEAVKTKKAIRKNAKAAKIALLETSEPEEEDFDVEKEFPLKKPLPVDPIQLSNLSEEERMKIRSEHLEMHEYFYMTHRDKSKFFHLLNLQYRKNIKQLEPPGSAPMKKTIKFKKRFQIKPFDQKEKSEIINKKKSFMEIYKARDESKSKKLSRAIKS